MNLCLRWGRYELFSWLNTVAPIVFVSDRDVLAEAADESLGTIEDDEEEQLEGSFVPCPSFIAEAP